MAPACVSTARVSSVGGSPYPGYAFIRLARQYDGEISADAHGFILTGVSDVVREVFDNPVWGAGQISRVTVENPPTAALRVEGAISRRQSLSQFLAQLGEISPFEIRQRIGDTLVRFQAASEVVILPRDEAAYIEAPVLTWADYDSRVGTLEVHYRPDQKSAEMQLDISEAVDSNGPRREADLPYVYDSETADRVLYAASQRELSGRETVRFRIDPRRSGYLPLGQRIRFPAGIVKGEDSDWVIRSLRHSADKSIVVTATKYLPGLFAYPVDRTSFFDTNAAVSIETDFSQTPPEPLRNLRGETRETSTGSGVHECAITYTPPRENYGGAEFWAVYGTDDPVLVTREASPGKAFFILPKRVPRYKVVGYSLSPEPNVLRGYPVEFEVNRTPVANAGPDRSVSAGASVTLNGSGSTDPDSDPLTYSWRQLSGPVVTLQNSNTVTPRFTAPSRNSSSRLEFELTVSDGSQSSTDSVMINVRAYVYVSPVPGRVTARSWWVEAPLPGEDPAAGGDLGFSVWGWSFSRPRAGAQPTHYEARDSGRFPNWLTIPGEARSGKRRGYVEWVEFRACNSSGCGPATRIRRPST